MRWTETHAEMQGGCDRFFDLVVQKGLNAEQEKEDRAANLEKFKALPKRGAPVKAEEDNFPET